MANHHPLINLKPNPEQDAIDNALRSWGALNHKATSAPRPDRKALREAAIVQRDLLIELLATRKAKRMGWVVVPADPGVSKATLVWASVGEPQNENPDAMETYKRAVRREMGLDPDGFEEEPIELREDYDPLDLMLDPE